VKEQQGHGLDEYLEKLNALPKEVHVTVTREAETDFDRRVRAALDRLHRRQQIAEN
jgi:hypothetical protein